MSELIFRSDVTVRLTRVEGDDADIACAAWASTKGERAEDFSDPARLAGFLNMLMRDRHGSPYEQVGMQFLVTAPIFVWREHMRHRIASYNEQSGRYSVLDPVFYVPDDNRKVVQEGKPGAYTFAHGSKAQVLEIQAAIRNSSRDAYAQYSGMLLKGCAKEVARGVLPVNICSTSYVRINLRSLMNFLSLRVGHTPESRYPSFPLREIEVVAEQYEANFAEHFPIAHGTFVKHGRVAP